MNILDKYNVIKENDDLIVEYIDRPDRKVIGGMYSFKLKFEVAVVLSIIAALITIVDFLFTKSQFTLLFVLSVFGLFIYAIDNREKLKGLQKSGIVYKNQEPILYEENGEVYHVKKYGFCPICNGKVYISYDEKFKRNLGKCENSNDHVYTYDHTINSGVPYVIYDFYQK